MSNPTELPIDLIHDFRDAINIAHHRADHVGDSVRKRRWQDVSKRLEIYAAARRAQPEGEAPQAVPAMWVQYIDGVKTQNVARDDKEKATVESIHRTMAPGTKMTWRALYDHAPAATFSPLRGAQLAATGDRALLAALAEAAEVFMKGGVAPLRPLIDRAKAVAAQQAAAPGAQLVIGVAAPQGATISIMQPHADGTTTVIYGGTHPAGDSMGRAVVAAAPANSPEIPDGSLADEGTSAPGTPEAPSGYAVVPIEPTERMIYEGGIGRRDQMVDAADVWRQMLRAAQLDGGQEGSES